MQWMIVIFHFCKRTSGKSFTPFIQPFEHDSAAKRGSEYFEKDVQATKYLVLL
jgi:hypothetical protein